MSHRQTTSQRRWYQFSLRALLVVTALAAGLAFAWVKTIEPYRLQREALAAITKLGGSFKTEDATGWVRYLDKNAQDVVVVDLADCDKPDEYLPHLLRLPKLRTLVIGGHSVGDEQAAALGRVGSLKGLVVDSTKVNGELLEGFKQSLPDLLIYKSDRRASAILKQRVEVLDAGKMPAGYEWERPDVPFVPPEWLNADAADAYFATSPVVVGLDARASDGELLTWLADLVECRAVFATNLGDNALATVIGLPTIENLYLMQTTITDERALYLTRTKSLRRLSLDGTVVTDKGIAHLAKCSGLIVLTIKGSAISADAVEILRKALPKCDIRYSPSVYR